MQHILQELNQSNSTNYKIDTLRKYKDNKNLQRLLKMTYDKVAFTYGITMKNIPEIKNYSGANSLTYALTVLEQDLATRNVTGNAAIDLLTETLSCLSKEDAKILELVIGRDLKINMGRTNINKVIKNLITKPPYERCDIGTSKNIKKNINFNEKVFSQTKMDGTYRSSTFDAGNITILSRSGQEEQFPIIEKELKTLNIDAYTLIGEMTLRGEKDRKKGNGLINSDNPPHEDIIYTVWDMIPAHEYSMDKEIQKKYLKTSEPTKYEDRLELLEKTLSVLPENSHVQLIDYKIIKNMKEAFEHFQEVTEEGGEGTVIKSHDMVWKDGTSKQQLKVKLEIFLEVRCTGFTEGTKGTKREKTFGAMTFTNDEGTIQGQCSGFSDKELETINSDRNNYIGKVFEIKCNDITKSKNKDHYALSHANFQEFRNDKDTTDTLERALELKEMAMNLKDFEG